MSKILVVVSVDWEGRSLLDENLNLMKSLRSFHPDVPLQHFLNAVYFTKEGADINQTEKKIHSVLLPDDDHGLHIHAWNSLFQEANVTAKAEPVFSDASCAKREDDDWHFYKNDWGYDVPIDRYTTDELSSVIATSIRILTSHGFSPATSFRAGAWMAGQNVMEALAQNNIVMDSSALNRRYIKQRYGTQPLFQWVSDLWSHIDARSQPYSISTETRPVWEVPNNGCLADYTTADDMLDVFQQNVELWRENSDENVFVSIGFHQESSRRYLDRVNEALVRIKRLAKRENLPVVFTGRPQDYL